MTGDAGVTQQVTQEAALCVTHGTTADLRQRAEREQVTQVTHTGGTSYSPQAEEKEGGKDLPDPASPASHASLRHPTPTEWLLALLDHVRAEPVGAALRQCPAHLDSTPSLSIKAAPDGRALVHCFAGCPTEDVLDALTVSWRHLHAEPWLTPEQHLAITRPRLTFPPLTARPGSPSRHGFRLEKGNSHLYGTGWLLERWRHPTTGAKELRWFTIRGGAAIPGLFGTPLAALPLYRENEVRMAVGAREPVVVCESESSVDALCSAGMYATTWAGGASVPNLDRLATVLRGARVVLVPDNDPAGLACGEAIRAALTGLCERVRTVLPSPGQDARDLLADRGPVAFALPHLVHREDDPTITNGANMKDADPVINSTGTVNTNGAHEVSEHDAEVQMINDGAASDEEGRTFNLLGDEAGLPSVADGAPEWLGEGTHASTGEVLENFIHLRETVAEEPHEPGHSPASVFPAPPAPEAHGMHTDAVTDHLKVTASDDLGERGRALWADVTETYVLRTDELALLAEMCRTVDTLAAMRAALADTGSVVTAGSKGQDRAHPLLGEIRGAQQVLIRLAAQLTLPDADGTPAATPASRKAARASNERWRRDWEQSGEAVGHGED